MKQLLLLASFVLFTIVATAELFHYANISKQLSSHRNEYFSKGKLAINFSLNNIIGQCSKNESKITLNYFAIRNYNTKDLKQIVQHESGFCKKVSIRFNNLFNLYLGKRMIALQKQEKSSLFV